MYKESSSEWTPGVGDEQGGLACCDSWGHKELDTTERLNWTDDYSHSEYKKKVMGEIAGSGKFFPVYFH